MKKFIEKLIGRLEDEKDTAYNTYMCLEMKVDLGRAFGVERAIEIVNELAEEYKPKTNADKIRTMNDEELAEWLFKHDTITYCHGRLNTEELLQWLQSEAE